MKLLPLLEENKEKKCLTGKCKVCTCEWNNCAKQEDGTWIDNVTGIRFGTYQHYGNSQEGGFLTDAWRDSDRKNLPQITNSGFTITPEGSYTEINQVDTYRKKKILIIGAGPSTDLLTKEHCESVDYVWTCNHFFKHEQIRSMPFNLVSLGNEVDLNSKELAEYYDKNPQCLTMMNMTINRSWNELGKFSSKRPLFYYASRWFGRIGEVPRMAVMAALWAASEIHFIGMDGHSRDTLKSKKSDSVFEPDKHLRLSSYDYDLQRRQFVVYFDYMRTTFPGVKLVNLGRDWEHNSCKFINGG